MESRSLGRAAELFRRFALEDVAGDLDAVAPAFFREDVGDVHLDGSGADAKLVRDLFVAQPARGERSLSRRQSLPFCFSLFASVKTIICFIVWFLPEFARQ